LIYFHSLELENVRCFGDRQVLQLTDEQGRLAQWTLLLGDNGVGKTTLLQCLAWMRPVPRVTKSEGEPDAIEPALNNEENNVLNSLLRVGSSVTLELKATLTIDQGLGVAKRKIHKIETGMHLEGQQGELQERELTTNSFPGKRPHLDLLDFPIFAYGAARRMGSANLDRSELSDPLASLFSTAAELYDAEEILLQLDYLAARRSQRNYGHGYQHLSVVFAVLMMLAFLVDQVQQLCCRCFKRCGANWGVNVGCGSG
jgi:energy-coupling factor transporter ATP-binding protein EcfA2